MIINDLSPNKYKFWVERILRRKSSFNTSDLVFGNAQNEWGENNHLEPDFRYARAYLTATKTVLYRSIRRD